jgi:hypothetical protein
MPDSIKFEIIGKMLLFLIKGMPEIKLKMKVAPTKVVLGAASDKLHLH